MVKVKICHRKEMSYPRGMDESSETSSRWEKLFGSCSWAEGQ